jgi:hypothetical protein
MRKSLIIILLGLALTGCASGCREACVFGFGPGNAMFDKVADHYDSTDPCQTREFSTLTGERLKPAGYTVKDIPKWCGAGKRTQRAQILDRNGRRIGEIRY